MYFRELDVSSCGPVRLPGAVEDRGARLAGVKVDLCGHAPSVNQRILDTHVATSLPPKIHLRRYLPL